MRPEVLDDWAWTNTHGDLVRNVIATNAGRLLDVRDADDEQDRKYATDLVLTLDTGEVALRIRRKDCKYRDLTLRYQRRRGAEWVRGFEVDKVLEGFARWYLYIWVGNPDWLFADLDRVREAGLIEAALADNRVIPNTDGRTTFTWLEIDELDQAKALVAISETLQSRLRPERQDRATDDVQLTFETDGLTFD